MNWLECKSLVYSDLCRITDKHTKIAALKLLFLNYSFKVTFWFRIGSYLQNKIKWRLMYYFVCWYYDRIMYKTGIQLPLGTKVGAGLRFYHFGDVVVNGNSIIGKNASIYNGVTIGINFKPDCVYTKPPILGDNVVLCTGSKVIGDVCIGSNCVIGANAVVTKDIPEDSVAVGIPAAIIHKSGGGNYVTSFINHL